MLYCVNLGIRSNTDYSNNDISKKGKKLRKASKYGHTISPNWSLYISFKNELREFDKRSNHFFFAVHFIKSHNLSSWLSMDIVGRRLMFVTIGT